MRKERTVLHDTCMRLMMPQTLSHAIHDAAARDQLTLSEYLRSAIKDRLRRDRAKHQEDAAA